MEKRLLQLCKRLKKCTLDDILSITDIDKEQINNIISMLMSDGKLEYINGYYVISENKTPSIENHYFDLMTDYKSSEDINLIIRCFCCNIPAYKTILLVNAGATSIKKYYDVFRSSIYNKQLNDLKNLYIKNPQKSHYRLFFDKIAYFYIYNNKVYVTDAPYATANEKIFSKKDKAELKKINSYLHRVETHNKNSIDLKYKLAEAIWRRNKNFDEMYSELKSMLNIKIL